MKEPICRQNGVHSVAVLPYLRVPLYSGTSHLILVLAFSNICSEYPHFHAHVYNSNTGCRHLPQAPIVCLSGKVCGGGQGEGFSDRNTSPCQALQLLLG